MGAILRNNVLFIHMFRHQQIHKKEPRKEERNDRDEITHD
ncbi:hypothetical protein VRK_30180 [Vibrio sp. MEBiC08052]|nr:hypothetical protein VRK_30180 [Vibrio sp. MEBiC08052]